MDLKQISVTVLAKDSQKYLYEVLRSLASFGEVLLYDTGSSDNTMDIGRSFSYVRVVSAPFNGFGPTHNSASAAARFDWILSIDSDEVVTGEMIDEIARVVPDPQSVYSFPRRNYFNGKFIRWCGWYPDRQFRLYNRTKTRFSDVQVHEGIITQGMKTAPLQGAMVHYSYAAISDFLSKMQVYSTLFAEQNRGKKTSSPFKAVVHGMFAFFKSYLLKRGFLGGYEGFIISSYNAHTAYYKYLKLYEANSKKGVLTNKSD